jgi:biopolymer transport protein ExbD
MKLSSHKFSRRKTLDLNMTPMIDCIFLLLIFFVTTSSFRNPEKELDPGIKLNEKSATQAKTDFEPAIIEVVQSGGSFVYKMGAREIRTYDELVGLLRQFTHKADGAIVRVSDGAPFGMAAGAIQACKSADFFTVSYVPASYVPLQAP